MNWLLLLYFLEIGFSPVYQSMNIIDEYTKIENRNVYYIHFDTEVLILDHFFIGGSTKIFMHPQANSYQFFPIENDFLFKTGFRYKGIDAGFRHQCNHPILNHGVASQGKSYGGFEEFYIRISNGF